MVIANLATPTLKSGFGVFISLLVFSHRNNYTPSFSGLFCKPRPFNIITTFWFRNHAINLRFCNGNNKEKDEMLDCVLGLLLVAFQSFCGIIQESGRFKYGRQFCRYLQHFGHFRLLLVLSKNQR